MKGCWFKGGATWGKLLVAWPANITAILDQVECNGFADAILDSLWLTVKVVWIVLGWRRTAGKGQNAP